MNKREQDFLVFTETAFDAKGKGVIGSTEKWKYLRPTWIATMCLCVAMWLTLAAFSSNAAWIDVDGFLHEPLFGLIPVSFILLLVSVVLASVDLTRSFGKSRSAHCQPKSSRVA